VKPDLFQMVQARNKVDVSLNTVLCLLASTPTAPLAESSFAMARGLVTAHCTEARRALDAFENAALGRER
jgi:hypothetical protein